jgi:PTS system nitrogen regulatory IIA component
MRGERSGVSDKLLTSAELAEVLGFAAGTIVDWAEKGTIPAFKLGGRLRFRESEVLDWLEAQRVRAGARGEAPTTPQHPPGVVSVLPTTPDRRGGEDAS